MHTDLILSPLRGSWIFAFDETCPADFLAPMKFILFGVFPAALPLVLTGCGSPDVGVMPPALGANLPSPLVQQYGESTGSVAAKRDIDCFGIIWSESSISRNAEGFHGEECGGLLLSLLVATRESADYARDGKLTEYDYSKRSCLGLLTSRRGSLTRGQNAASDESFHLAAGSFGYGSRRDGTEYMTILWIPITTHTPASAK